MPVNHELKPCPFCGGKAKLEEIGTVFEIWCLGCEVTLLNSNEQKAVVRWNTRV